MSITTIVMICRAVLLLLSFSGLCAAVYTRFKLSFFIAPYVVVCGIITTLMLAGMLHVLEPAFWLLYFAGFAGLIYKILTPPPQIYG